MKTLENILHKACSYTVIILGLFYLFGTLTGSNVTLINAKSFLLIALFGLLISLAELILHIKKIHVLIRVLLHYLILLISFYTVFISSGNIKAENAGQIFVAAVIFTIFYAFMFGFVYILRRFISKADKNIIQKQSKNNTQKTKKSSYRPLYKNEDDE